MKVFVFCQHLPISDMSIRQLYARKSLLPSPSPTSPSPPLSPSFSSLRRLSLPPSYPPSFLLHKAHPGTLSPVPCSRPPRSISIDLLRPRPFSEILPRSTHLDVGDLLPFFLPRPAVRIRQSPLPGSVPPSKTASPFFSRQQLERVQAGVRGTDRSIGTLGRRGRSGLL